MMFQGLDLSLSSGTQKELGCFHWALNQSASVVYKTLVGDVGSTFHSQFYCCDPPARHSATEYSPSEEVNSYLSPNFVTLEISPIGLQKLTTCHSLVPDELILHLI